MPRSSVLVADAIAAVPTVEGNLTVTLSNELVHLLSDQLYQSPSKAVEELVVNAYDADAQECKLFIPSPSDYDRRFLVVYDDGSGMDYAGLVNLWHIGRSTKTGDRMTQRRSRKQIGKFGIGKLATYTLANQLTYISRTGDSILSVSLDFGRFQSSATGAGEPVTLSVKRITDWDAFASNASIREICAAADIDPATLVAEAPPSWTIAVLESLKPKAAKLKGGVVRHVLRTAMPLKTDFKVYLNGEEVESIKDSYNRVVEFDIADLPESRLRSLTKKTGEPWRTKAGRLVCPSLPSGVIGSAMVTAQSLLGKSDDLQRSNGFFVYVRDRLVNLQDPLFGIHTPSLQTFNRFRADIEADDLDAVLTAPREGVEESPLKDTFQALLVEVYLEARARYTEHLIKEERGAARKAEDERNFVNERLVEFPIADVIATHGTSNGADADEGWFYLDVPGNQDAADLVSRLYGVSSTASPRQRYKYVYTEMGPSERMVKFDPAAAVFTINESHPFVRAHSDDGRARALLEDVVTSEALLEVYLRESGVPPHAIGEVLERRDLLLQSLADDHPFSLKYLADRLRDAAGSERDLEVAIVAAARGLGFVAKQISNAGEPDGVARFDSYPGGATTVTLEAKSSESVPSLSAIDFAGLHEHKRRYSANGCLLVAPSYPGSSKEDSAAAFRAKQLGISCWTANDLARVLAAAESRHITAEDVLRIVLNAFAPDEVAAEVNRLLEAPEWERRELYRAVLAALRELGGRLPDRPRSVDLVAAEVSRSPSFSEIPYESVDLAVRELAAASHRGLIYRDGGVIVLTVAIDELDRRVSGLTGKPGDPRRSGSFRDGF